MAPPAAAACVPALTHGVSVQIAMNGGHLGGESRNTGNFLGEQVARPSDQLIWPLRNVKLHPILDIAMEDPPPDDPLLSLDGTQQPRYRPFGTETADVLNAGIEGKASHGT
jgi:hypothetical protein